MRSFVAFVKKEAIENIRSGRALMLSILFVAFGVMNPAIAKLTPWMIEIFAESMEDSGMIITEVLVNSLTSWTQFFKNVPMALIVFVFVYSNTLTGECESGRLIPLLTKGLSRKSVILAKLSVITLIWTCGYWICYFVTYFYNAYFWDNSIARYLPAAAVYWWVFGLFVVCVIMLFSVLSKSYIGVLLGTGATVFLSYVLSLIPKLTRLMPTSLTNGMAILTGQDAAADYTGALILALALALISVITSLFIFKRKQL